MKHKNTGNGIKVNGDGTATECLGCDPERLGELGL